MSAAGSRYSSPAEADDRGQRGDGEQAAGPRDGVVHAARDARVVAGHGGEHGHGQRRDERREAEGEDVMPGKTSVQYDASVVHAG